MNNIPSDEEFARATRLMEERWRNLGAAEDLVLEKFSPRCPLFKVAILPGGENEFVAYIFFEKDSDVAACRASGIVAEISGYVYEALERVGRGPRADIEVLFEFDSDERVQRDFEGDYYLRML